MNPTSQLDPGSIAFQHSQNEVPAPGIPAPKGECDAKRLFAFCKISFWLKRMTCVESPRLTLDPVKCAKFMRTYVQQMTVIEPRSSKVDAVSWHTTFLAIWIQLPYLHVCFVVMRLYEWLRSVCRWHTNLKSCQGNCQAYNSPKDPKVATESCQMPRNQLTHVFAHFHPEPH